MHKTLLLCFIHGFKGGDDTFARFPEHLRASLSRSLPKITIRTIIYPKFETRGDLFECVGRFREWLQNTVIDLEVAAGTPSPTVDPSVRVVLMGHSMGGIVAAETYLSIANETPISHQTLDPSHSDVDSQGFMFPYIQGVLAFDTPYLGIAPGVLAHGAESHYQTASNAYTTISSAASALGFGRSSSPASQSGSAAGMLTAGPEAAKEALSASASASSGNGDAAATPAWQRWGRYAMFAGAAGAVAAGGAAAYLKRDALSSGWTWSTSHLEFVGCLMRGEELKQRIASMEKAHEERGTKFLNIYTTLGPQAGKLGQTVAGGFIEIGGTDGSQRTFCNLPTTESWKKFFCASGNNKAVDEVEAHMGMFAPRDNPGFYTLAEMARDNIVNWVDEKWYEASEPAAGTGTTGTEGVEDVTGEEPVLI